jgi:sulfur carrier protein
MDSVESNKPRCLSYKMSFLHNLLPLNRMLPTLTIQLNGHARTLPEFTSPTDLSSVIATLGLKADRIAVELNSDIISRSSWPQTQVAEGDRLEIVHFVGGGSDTFASDCISLM